MSATSSYCPSEGDIIYLDFDPQAGQEQAGRRPALVLSPEAYNRKAGLAVVCPITNQRKGYPFEVTLPSGTKATGVVLSDHIESLSWRARRSAYLCEAPSELLEDVRAMVKAVINID